MSKGNDDMKKFNEDSMKRLSEINPFIIPTNPGFFGDETMDSYGFQKFNVISNGDKNYLTVDRSIVHKKRKIDLNTSVYELDETSRITKLTGSIRKKIRSMLPFKRGVD